MTGLSTYVAPTASLVHCPTRRSRTIRRLAQALAAVTLTAPLFTLVACGESGWTEAPVRAVDTSLVGTWVGTIRELPNGDIKEFTMVLDADSTMTARTDESSANGCITGTWTLAGPQMTITARDCSQTPVTYVASGSTSVLTGTWSTNTGVHGSFAVGK